MSLSIPAVTYGFPVGGIAGRKLAKQALIPNAVGGIVYLPGGSAGQPISPSFLGSWSDTSNANRWRGYVAFSLAEKLGQGGGSAPALMEINPTHGGGTQTKSYLLAQHVIQLPDLFTPPSSIRGVTRGAFEIANSSANIYTDTTYRGCVSAIIGPAGKHYTHVSGAFTPDPNETGDPDGTSRLIVALRLLDFNGDPVSTLLSPTGTITITGSDGSGIKGSSLFAATPTVSLVGTRPNNRKAAYLVSEIGLEISASGNNFTYLGAGVWWRDYMGFNVEMDFDDSSSDLMQSGDTGTMRSTWFSMVDYGSTYNPDYSDNIRGVSR